MNRPIYKILNIKNLRNNFFLIRKLSKNKNIWLVVKSDAYGHGIKNIYNILSNYVDGFSVLSIKEALYLRNIGWNKSILLLEGIFSLEELKLCLKYNFSIVIHSFWQIELFKKILDFSNRIHIYLKLNSNINRLGFLNNEFNNIYNIIKSFKIVKYLSLIIHITLLSKDSNFFSLNKEYIKIFNLGFKEISISSSLGLIWGINDIYSTWIRVGILLYGLSPTGNINDILNYGFKPVMSFKSKIISIKIINKNQFIGYSNSFLSVKKRLVGVVACGYADGYPRQLSNRYYVLVNKKIKAQILGYISMDMMVIDLDNNYNIKIGDDVELWGEYLYVDDVAKVANTISYDLLSGISRDRVICKLR